MTSSEEVQTILAAWVAEATGLPETEVTVDEPFDLFGLDSAGAAALAARLGDRLGSPVRAAAFYEHPTIRALADHLTGTPAREALPAGPVAPGADVRAASPRWPDDVAIVGMACRFPGAAGLEEYWELLVQGTDAITDGPGGVRAGDPRWPSGEPAPGGYLRDIELFDREHFGISPTEAYEMDPQQRILLEVAAEALADAGVPRSGARGADIGVFLGASHSEYAAAELFTGAGITARTPTANAASIVANRVSYCLDLRGPSLVVDTACSSSLVAVYLAARSVALGETSAALAGGVNLILSPLVGTALGLSDVLAADHRCKPFDQRADGYVRSEGCAVIVLKPLARARADRDTVYAVIKGGAVGQDGRTNGLLAPNGRSQEEVLRRAYRAAGVAPADVDLVEAHGTGTRVGDEIEAGALGAVLGRAPDRRLPCLVGSVKSNIGHAEAAAGIAGLVKAALAMHRGTVPGTVHFTGPGDRIDLGGLGLRVSAAPRDESPRLAGVSSFGFGGTLAHVVLERAPGPAPDPVPAPVRRPRVLPVSAPTPGLLRAHCAALARACSGADPAALRYTLQQRRDHGRVRRAVVVPETGEGAERLAAAASGPIESGPRDPRPVFVFPGQGGTWRRRVAFLREALPGFAESLADSGDRMRELTGHGLGPWHDAGADDPAGPAQATNGAEQAAFTAVQMALTDGFGRIGVRPAAVVGHSLGEVAAAYAAGVYSRAEALGVAHARGEALARVHAEGAMGEGAMAVVELAAGDCERRFATGGADLWVAAENGPTTSVVAGTPRAVKDFVVELTAEGVFARVVPGVHFASHGPAMEPACVRLKEDGPGVVGREEAVPFFSSTYGERIPGTGLTLDHWVRNLRHRVRFRSAVDAAARLGHAVYLEIAPQTIVATGVRAALDAASAPHRVVSLGSARLEVADGLDQALAALYECGAEIDWGLFDDGRGACLHLPAPPWRHESFWKTPPTAALTGPSGEGWRRVDLARFPDLHVHERALDPGGFAGHVVAGRPLLPASAWLCMAGHAASSGGPPWGLRDVEVLRPLWLGGAEPITLQLATDPPGDPDGRFAVHARTGDGPWEEYLRGRVAPAPDLDAAGNRWTPPGDLRSRLPGPKTADELYRRLAAVSLTHGPEFRLVEELRVGDGEAIGRLRRWEPEPVALDAALHVVAALDPSQGDGPYLPHRLESLRILSPEPVYGAWSHALLRTPPGERGDELVADVRVVAEDGRLLAELTGLCLRRTRPAPPSSTGADAVHGYEVAWRPMRPESPKASQHDPPRALVWASTDPEAGDASAPAPGGGNLTRPELDHAFTPPEGPVETMIAEIWRRGLRIDRIGAHDSLFELGGDSVFGGQVLSKVSSEYGVGVEPAAVFPNFTVRHLAGLVEAALAERVAAMSDDEVDRLLAAGGRAGPGPDGGPQEVPDPSMTRGT